MMSRCQGGGGRGGGVFVSLPQIFFLSGGNFFIVNCVPTGGFQNSVAKIRHAIALRQQIRSLNSAIRIVIVIAVFFFP